MTFILTVRAIELSNSKMNSPGRGEELRLVFCVVIIANIMNTLPGMKSTVFRKDFAWLRRRIRVSILSCNHR